MRRPSAPGQGGVSRPGKSRCNLTQCTMRRPEPSADAIIELPRRRTDGRLHLTRSPHEETAPKGQAGRSMTLARTLRIALATTLGLVCLGSPAAAQYFGQNKVQYHTFKFQLLQTEHFDIYHYPEETDAAEIASRLAERWYSRLSRFFSHELRGRQAVILYAAPGHFRETNAIEGLIGEGTGGVTEALKRRIVLPMSGSLADTDH